MRRRHSQHGRLTHARQRHKTKSCGGNDPKRTFRANEHLLHIIAGIVLAQRFQPVKHGAVRQHHLDTEDLLPGVTVFDRVVAPCICRKRTANRA